MSTPEARIAAAAQAAGMAGWAVALSAPGRAALHWGGEDWPGSGRPVTSATRFGAASTGKHATAAAILELAAMGKLSTNAAIGTLMPGLPAAWQGITVDQLLRHTSGLPEYLLYQAGETVPNDAAGFLATYGHLEPITPPGTAWGYSNTNYILLGLLIAAIGGADYAQMVEAMWARAGAPSLRVGSPDWARAANAGRFPADARDADSAARAVIGDGDIVATPLAALEWLEALLARGGDDPLFAPARLDDGTTAPYACGWFVEPLGQTRIAHHAGHFDGWTAMAVLDHQAGAGVIALSNLAPGTTRLIRSLALGALEDFAPGSTPLGLAPLADDRPDLTATARAQFLRGGAAPDPERFAPALRAVIARSGNGRGILDLTGDTPPEDFTLVDRHHEGGISWRRYRLSYSERVEHLLVGTDADDRITWGWPL